MEVLELPIDQVFFDPNNANTHPEKSIQAIRSSLKKWGQQIPILVDLDNVIIAGNGRVEAMLSMGYKTVKVIRSDLQGFDRMAYALADNQTAKFAFFDENILEQQLTALANTDYEFPLNDLGFDFADRNDWNADFDAIAKVDGNEDGILAKIKITCPQEEKDELMKAIKTLLKDFDGAEIS